VLEGARDRAREPRSGASAADRVAGRVRSRRGDRRDGCGPTRWRNCAPTRYWPKPSTFVEWAERPIPQGSAGCHHRRHATRCPSVAVVQTAADRCAGPARPGGSVRRRPDSRRGRRGIGRIGDDDFDAHGLDGVDVDHQHVLHDVNDHDLNDHDVNDHDDRPRHDDCAVADDDRGGARVPPLVRGSVPTRRGERRGLRRRRRRRSGLRGHEAIPGSRARRLRPRSRPRRHRLRVVKGVEDADIRIDIVVCCGPETAEGRIRLWVRRDALQASMRTEPEEKRPDRFSASTRWA